MPRRQEGPRATTVHTKEGLPLYNLNQGEWEPAPEHAGHRSHGHQADKEASEDLRAAEDKSSEI